jgi:hypothetical protein
MHVSHSKDSIFHCSNLRVAKALDLPTRSFDPKSMNDKAVPKKGMIGAMDKAGDWRKAFG